MYSCLCTKLLITYNNILVLLDYVLMYSWTHNYNNILVLLDYVLITYNNILVLLDYVLIT